MSYHGDVAYEVWRNNRNSDRLDYDRVAMHQDNGRSAEEAAALEMRRWDEQARMRQMQEQQEAEYYAQQQSEQEQEQEIEETLAGQPTDTGGVDGATANRINRDFEGDWNKGGSE